MKGQIDMIGEFETEADGDYSYKKIASTKDGKITFHTSKAQYQINPTDTYIVARCSRENMTEIIEKKINNKQYDTSGNEVYICLNEDDFDGKKLIKIKEHFKFPLHLSYNKVKEHIYDNKAEEIDKVMKVLTQKKEKNNKDASCYEKGYIIGKTRKIVEDKKEQSDSKKTISTTRKKESKKEENNIITNNNPNNNNLIINNNTNNIPNNNHINQNQKNSREGL